MPIVCVKRKVAALSAPSNDDVMQKHEKRKKKNKDQNSQPFVHRVLPSRHICTVEECNANSVHGQLVAHMFMTSYKLERAVCILPKTDLPYVTSQFCDFRAGTCG